MVRIVKSAISKHRTLCGHCTALLEYYSNEVQERQYREIDGVLETVKYITCPQCRKEVHVN